MIDFADPCLIFAEIKLRILPKFTLLVSDLVSALRTFLFFFETCRSFAISTRYGSPHRENKGTPGIYLRRREDRWGACSAPPPRAAPRSAQVRSVYRFSHRKNDQLLAGCFLETPILFFSVERSLFPRKSRSYRRHRERDVRFPVTPL